MRFVFMVFILLAFSTSAMADIRSSVKSLFEQDMDVLDLARVKIEVDRLIDPTINVDKQLAEIDWMVATIERMLPRNADSWAKVETIRKFIYEAGPWNDNRAFSYDHDDPYGLDVRNKLLADYIQDRRGNCITMPFLFIILGQRLGLDVTPATAPLHVFVKFTDDQGVTHNLETTSGAGRARDSHYKKLLPITEASVVNQVFMTPLTREETVAVIAVVVVENLNSQGRYQDAMAVADIVLDHYPNFAYAMVKKSTSAYYLLKSKFYDPYPNVQDVPEDQKAYLSYLQQVNQSGFDKAESLGWRPVQR
ncbi:transglutaminase superfamily protein [Litoreibacter meonggei]|uniref:Transglutaminase superfamily protein n=1 Tax=Litoreibacter meonggei TaxID=1049199 RepID=A0A497VKC9_9RHOB|nr:transglutaminase family protein [Litoreibacter meonggei]RLJ40685.1 transglutaminase superfamily protein [Litoreibacter meonggei]